MKCRPDLSRKSMSYFRNRTHFDGFFSSTFLSTVCGTTWLLLVILTLFILSLYLAIAGLCMTWGYANTWYTPTPTPNINPQITGVIASSCIGLLPGAMMWEKKANCDAMIDEIDAPRRNRRSNLSRTTLLTPDEAFLELSPFIGHWSLIEQRRTKYVLSFKCSFLVFVFAPY